MFFFLSPSLPPFALTFPAELTQMGTCCPIKDTFKAKHVIHLILQEGRTCGAEYRPVYYRLLSREDCVYTPPPLSFLSLSSGDNL